MKPTYEQLTAQLAERDAEIKRLNGYDHKCLPVKKERDEQKRHYRR